MTDSTSTQKHAPHDLGRVLILGLGKSGKAVCRYCRALIGSRVESLHIAAESTSDDSRAFVESLDSDKISFAWGAHSFEGHFDLCIVSPGIPQVSAFYQKARASSDEIISEVEFAWRESKKDSRWIAITGTNGKTTTTALTAHILCEAGINAAAVGNIGSTCLEAVAEQATDVYVVEVSSYQLASTALFSPDIAILLNITPDHLDWHGGFDEYVNAKLGLFARLEARDHAYAILDATDDVVRRYVKQLKNREDAQCGFSYVPLGAAAGLAADMREVCGSRNAAFIDEGMLCLGIEGRDHLLVKAADLKIKGEHNAANALAAASAAYLTKVEPAAIRRALLSFDALEHRIEACGRVAGVVCYNDSKATNVDATRKALTAFGTTKPVVLLGGHDKGTDLDDLVRDAESDCKAVVCFGAAGPRFFQAFSGTSLPVYQADHLESALDKALSVSDPGDVVVLSPACASFDEFDSFEQRGRVFKELVARRSQERGV